MRRTAPALLAAALALGAVAIEGEDTSTADTTHPCYDATTDAISYEEQRVWFHEGETKVGNTAPAPWDTTEPSTSVQGGAGAGALTPGTAGTGAGTPADQHAVFQGTFTGCLDTMLFDVYSFDPTNRTGTSGTAAPANHNFALRVTIDGQDVFKGGPLEASTVLANEGMGPNLNRFAIDVSDTMEVLEQHTGVPLDGEHTIEVAIQSWYVNTGHSVYVWDTTEVPSGITFNGAITEDYATL